MFIPGVARATWPGLDRLIFTFFGSRIYRWVNKIVYLRGFAYEGLAQRRPAIVTHDYNTHTVDYSKSLVPSGCCATGTSMG